MEIQCQIVGKFMEWFLRRKATPLVENDAPSHEPDNATNVGNSPPEEEEINWEEEIQFDLGKRRRIEEYHPNKKAMIHTPRAPSSLSPACTTGVAVANCTQALPPDTRLTSSCSMEYLFIFLIIRRYIEQSTTPLRGAMTSITGGGAARNGEDRRWGRRKGRGGKIRMI